MSRRLALLIATYDYEDAGLRRLTTPAHDAETLAEVLADPSIAGFEVTTLVNEPLHRVGRAIGEFYRDRRRDDLTLLYFTGHGLKDDEGRLYLAMTNTMRDNLLFTGLPAEQVGLAVEGCASRRKILVLDCCYSGAFPAGRRTKADPTVHTLERFQGRGRTVLTASDATQYSFEGAGDQPRGQAAQSVFTRYLVAGLRDGSADLDGDGDITVDELYSYAYDRVVEEMPQQRPKKQDDVQGRTIIARNVNWTLPTYLANALASPIATDRLNALDGLAHLRRVGNEQVKARAEQEIRRLADDDSRQVSTAATALLTPTDPPVTTTAKPAPALPAPKHKPAPAEPTPAEPTPKHKPAPAEPTPAEPAPAVAAPPESKPERPRPKPEPSPTTDAARPAEAAQPTAAPPAPEPAPATPPPPTAATPQPRRARIDLRRLIASRRARTITALLTALALIATGVALWLNRDKTEYGSGPNNRPAAHVITGTAERVVLSPDAKTVAGFTTGAAGERVRLWDVQTGREVDDLAGNANSFAFSTDPNTLALPGEDGAAVLWDRTTHLARATLTGTTTGPTLAFTPDAKTIATASTCACTDPFDNPVRLWNTADGQSKATLPGHTNGVQDMSFSRDGRLLLTAAVDRTVRVWDVATGKNTATIDAGYVATFSPDGTMIAASSHFTEKISLWDTATGRRIRLLDGIGQPFSFSTDGKTLATTDFNRKVGQLWDVATGKLINTGTADGPFTISPDHRTLAIGAGNDVQLLDAATGNLKESLTGHTARVADLTYSADGRTLVSAGTDGKIRVWQVG
ncbi:caspase, EACC1-associated type [Actinosynnema sp. CA-248983]